jgi:hypothetical protein
MGWAPLSPISFLASACKIVSNASQTRARDGETGGGYLCINLHPTAMTATCFLGQPVPATMRI